MDNLTRFAVLYKKNNEIPIMKVLGKRGNMKVPSTTAIFNFTPAKSCPSMRKGLCSACKQNANCYARKAEYLYPDVLPYREKQAEFWQHISAEDFVTQFVVYNATRIKKFTLLRFSESGDFIDQKNVEKAEKIATLLRLYGIKTYTYTSRSDLDFSKCRNMIITGSNFKKAGISNVVKIVKDWKDRPKGYGKCAMDCRVCNRCMIRGRMTVIKKH
jgi:hypothetical protein